MKCFGLTDKGRVRKDNQDSFIIEKCEAKNCLIVGLCDGMGGAKAGGLASQLSNKAFVDFVYGKLTSRVERVQNYKDMLQSACDEANGVSYEYSKFDEAYNGMGTTIVGGVIKNSGKAHIINVGDSRAYLIDGQQCRQVTRDHSVVQELVEMGEIDEDQAKKHPQRNVITRSLGPDDHTEIDLFEVDVRKKHLLLCSDGLHGYFSAEELFAYISTGRSDEETCRLLVQEACARGGRDNITIILIHCA